MAESVETMETTEQTETDDLARTIAVAGRQVSQAAGELRQAAEQLTSAEEQAHQADARRRTAEEQIAQGASKNAELLELLQRAREAQSEAEERARRAEQPLQEARVALAQAEERARGSEQPLQEAQAARAEAEESARQVTELLETARAAQAEAEEHARRAELPAQEARAAQAESEERAMRAEQRVKITVERTELMEEQLKALESRALEAEARPQVTLVVDDERNALQEAVAADVRRPLTSILGLTLALKHADPQSTEGTDMIRQLATNARKLDRLVGEMLALDKIVSGVFEPNLRRTDLEALVRRVVDESPDLANRDIKIESEHVAIQVDPALTEQMVETLLSNAGRRTTPGNPVWVKISSDQGGAVIAVDDTGPEVPLGLRGAMVAALSDDGPAARQMRPRGATGLTLLARLAEIHGGRAWVEERPGGGASFRVFLPAAREPHKEPQQDSADESAAARVLDVNEDRAAALARALVNRDQGEARSSFDRAAVSTNGHPSSDLDVTGEVVL